MFFWSANFIVMKLALDFFHPVVVLFARMLGGALLLFPMLPRWSRSMTYAKGDWRFITLLVLCEPCLFFMFEGYALRYTTASQAGLISALLPLLVGVGAFWILRERLPRRAWVGFVIALGGVVLLTMAAENTEKAPNAFLGNSLELCAMLLACVYTLCVRKLMSYSPFLICAMQTGAGSLFFGVMLFVTGAPIPETLPPPQALLTLAFLSISTVIPYSLYNIGVARLSAGQAAAWTNLIPLLTLGMGMLFLGEALTSRQVLAVPLILLGVVLSQGSGKKE